MKDWEKEERRLARRRGGVRTPGSGSGWRRRGDVREGETVLWEQKTTGNRQYTIKEDDWEKFRKNALLDGRTPKLHITLGRKKRRLVVMEEGDDEADDPA